MSFISSMFKRIDADVFFLNPSVFVIVTDCARDCFLYAQALTFSVLLLLFTAQRNMDIRFTRGKSAVLERSLSRPRTEVSLSAFALLFSEMVQYCQSRVYSVSELQARLADMGRGVGASMLDLLVLREKNGKRETKVLNILLFIKACLFYLFIPHYII